MDGPFENLHVKGVPAFQVFCLILAFRHPPQKTCGRRLLQVSKQLHHPESLPERFASQQDNPVLITVLTSPVTD